MRTLRRTWHSGPIAWRDWRRRSAAVLLVPVTLAGLPLIEGEVPVSPAVLWPAALVVGAAAVLAGRLAWRAWHSPSLSGVETLVGRQAPVAHLMDAHNGQVLLDGSWWTVRSRTAVLHKDQPVVVMAVDGVVLLVEPINPEEGLP